MLLFFPLDLEHFLFDWFGCGFDKDFGQTVRSPNLWISSCVVVENCAGILFQKFPANIEDRLGFIWIPGLNGPFDEIDAFTWVWGGGLDVSGDLREIPEIHALFVEGDLTVECQVHG